MIFMLIQQVKANTAFVRHAVQLEQFGDQLPQFLNQQIGRIRLRHEPRNGVTLGYPNASFAVPQSSDFINATGDALFHPLTLSWEKSVF